MIRPNLRLEGGIRSIVHEIKFLSKQTQNKFREMAECFVMLKIFFLFFGKRLLKWRISANLVFKQT